MTVTELLSDHSHRVRRVARAVRRLVRDVIPDAEERVYPGWHGIGYKHPEAGYVCGIFPRTDSVEVGFERGHLLDDPAGLFTKSGKQVRYVVLRELDESTADALAELVEAAVAIGSKR